MEKNVCFICGGLSGGGQERAMVNYANLFAENQYKVSIICLFNTEIFYKVNEDIKIYWPEIDRRANNKFIYALKLISFVRASIKDSGSIKVISFGDWFNSFVLFSTLFSGREIYITNRMGPDKGYGTLLNICNKLLYPLSDGMIVQTERAANIMYNRFKLKKIVVVENVLTPININELNPQKNIITVGRLSREKGHSLLLKSFSKIESKEWNLIIIGDGPELTSLKNLALKLEVQDRVHFMGHLKDFNQYLMVSSIFVLPSFYEGFPNALIEAMSVPLASIASDCVAGPREIINHGENGYLFKPGNEEELTFYLNELIEDEVKRTNFAKSAFAVRNRFTIENSYTKFEYFIFN